MKLGNLLFGSSFLVASHPAAQLLFSPKAAISITFLVGTRHSLCNKLHPTTPHVLISWGSGLGRRLPDECTEYI